MDGLYFSLYIFFTKIAKVHRDWKPIYSVTGVISLIPITLWVPFYDALNELYFHIGMQESALIIVSIYMLVDHWFYLFFKDKEDVIIKTHTLLPTYKKIFCYVYSLLIVLLIFCMWYFNIIFHLTDLVKHILI